MKLSACIIAKDEEKNIRRLLKSLNGKFDEIILVDTGSKDRTKDIAREFGCKVIEHTWNGFADARNRAVREASGDWLWHFDADFELEEEEFRKALLYLKNLPEDVDGILIGVKNLDKSGKVKSISSQIFLHRKKDGILWKGRIHETVNAKLVIGLPIYVKHYGYADYETQIKKAYRNLELLEEEIRNLDPYSREYKIKLFYLVQTYAILSYENKENLEKTKLKALEFLEAVRGEEDKLRFFSIYVYNYLLNALEMLGEEELYEKHLEEILLKEPQIPDFYLRAFSFYKVRKEFDKACEYLFLAAQTLDEIEKYPFKNGMACASDKLLEFYTVLRSEDIREVLESIPIFKEKLENEWRKSKGKYLGLLLAVLYDGEKKTRFLRKLALRYKNDEMVVAIFLDHLKQKDISILRNDLDKFSDVPVSLAFKAFLLEKEGKQEEALRFYSEYLDRTNDPFVAKYLISRYPEIGEKFRGVTKNSQSTSDNRK